MGEQDNRSLPGQEAGLAELRLQINELDRQILELFDRRMAIARSVARQKARSGAEVYDAHREEEVVTAAVGHLQNKEDNLRAETLLRSLMRLSRGAQYDLLSRHDETFRLGNQIRQASADHPEPAKVVFQGNQASYSARAARLLYPAVESLGADTFAEACRLVVAGDADVAVLPLENTTAGTVDDVYDLLLQNDLYIWRSVSLPVRHRLLARPGVQLQDIRQVISHPQALAQCSDMIRRQGWHVQESLNTAFAADFVARSDDPTLAAIASDEAAKNSGLAILLPDICNHPDNQTRFIAVGRTLTVSPQAGRLSMVLRLPHRSGSLVSTLAIFSDRGLNLSKIQSRPDAAHPWTYLFYLDVDCLAGDHQALAALYHLSREMPYFRLLGWYLEWRATDDAGGTDKPDKSDKPDKPGEADKPDQSAASGPGAD